MPQQAVPTASTLPLATAFTLFSPPPAQYLYFSTANIDSAIILPGTQIPTWVVSRQDHPTKLDDLAISKLARATIASI